MNQHDDPYAVLLLAVTCDQDRDESPFGWSEPTPDLGETQP
ncbi:hypothetical protein ACLQ2N_16445 [Streptomyces sp. DT224]